MAFTKTIAPTLLESFGRRCYPTLPTESQLLLSSPLVRERPAEILDEFLPERLR
jgi:hypothetical protein